MHTRISLKLVLVTLGIAGVVFVYLGISSLTPSLPALNSNMRTVKSEPSIAVRGPVKLPPEMRLKIPSLKIDVKVESVGLTPQGNVDVPKIPSNVAWFKLGPVPGEKGSSVIDGHSGFWQNGTPAVFENLNKLQLGNKIYVEDIKGATTVFVVRELRSFGQNETVPEVFSSSDGKAHLNLITCEGVWDNIQKSYSDRLVVFADKEIQ